MSNSDCRSHKRLILIQRVIVLTMAWIASCASAVLAHDSGFDFGYSARIARDLRSYRAFTWRPALHLRKGALTYRFQYGIGVVDIGGRWFIPTTTAITYAGLLFSEIANSHTALVLSTLPNSDLEFNLDRLHRLKILIGMDTDYLLWNGDAQRGIILAPHTGIQVVLGRFNIRLTASYDYFWRFNGRDLDAGPSIGIGVFSGPEFYWTSHLGFLRSH